MTDRAYFDPTVGITAKAIIRNSTMTYSGISGKEETNNKL
jgi:hypothetical protein